MATRKGNKHGANGKTERGPVKPRRGVSEEEIWDKPIEQGDKGELVEVAMKILMECFTLLVGRGGTCYGLLVILPRGSQNGIVYVTSWCDGLRR